MSDPMDAFRASGITAEQAVANWVSAVKASLQPREKPPMTNLADWLLAQIAADEWAAQCLHDIDCDIHRGFADERGDCDCGEPARVLAECAAKRAIVELYQARLSSSKAHEGDLALAGSVLTLLSVIQFMAQPYADREGFDPAWRVDS